MPVSTDVKREWARRGALARLQELEQERAAILKVYPDLRRARQGASAAAADHRRPRRQLSAAMRKKMSAGMRKWWAKRRKKTEGA